MILVYPVLLVLAAIALWLAPRQAGGRGGRWFAAWTAAGAVFMFSFLTGFSIGLFIFPVAAALVIWLVRAAPGPREASGFVAGVGLMFLVVVFL
jgi:hypothetical protein